MSFGSDLRRFQRKVELRSQAVFQKTVAEVARSLNEGSVLTGAPGQPVAPDAPPGARRLRGSFQEKYLSPTSAEVSTSIPWAADVEDGMKNGKPMQLRSDVGGFHSVKLTRAGFGRIVGQALEEVKRGS